MLRILLDGQEVENTPKGLDGISERLYESDELRCRLSEVNGTITFMGADRDIIYDAWIADSCATITIEIQKQNSQLIFDNVFVGLIFLSDVVFKDNSNEVECEIVDNSFMAKIENNRDLQMNLANPISKNGVDISGEYAIYGAADIFTHSPGGGTYTNRYCITIWNAFAALVAFMTDAEVSFASDFFNNPTLSWTAGNQYVLVKGSALADSAVEELPTISFDELYTDLQRCYNLRIGIESGDDGRPVLRIEPVEYFLSTEHIELTDIESIEYKRKPNNAFDSILVGSEIADEINQIPVFNTIWNSWKTRSYLLQGACNDGQQDLNLKWETLCPDVEVMDEQGSGTVEQDDTPFYVAVAFYGGGADEYWNPYELYAAGFNFNNKSTRNGDVIDRWQNYIYSPLANFEYAVNDMKATRTTQQTMVAFTEVIFDNDSTDGNFDNGSTYDNTTGFYTCVITGTYRMRFNITLASATNSSTFTLGFAFSFGGGPNVIGYYYPGQVLPQSYTLNAGESQTFELEYEAPFLEGTGNPFAAEISVMVNKTAGTGTLTVEPDSYFEILTPASGTFREFSANTAFSKEINSIGFINDSDWNTIKQNRDYILYLNGVDRIHDGYGMDIERNILSGKSNIKLLGRLI